MTYFPKGSTLLCDGRRGSSTIKYLNIRLGNFKLCVLDVKSNYESILGKLLKTFWGLSYFKHTRDTVLQLKIGGRGE